MLSTVLAIGRAKTIALVTVLLVGAATGLAAGPLAAAVKPPAPPGLVVSVGNGWLVNVTATGLALNITDRALNYTARVSFNATVTHATHGGAHLNVTGGQVSVGNITYAIENGTLRLGAHSAKAVGHLWLIGVSGTAWQVILHGELGAALGTLATPGNVVPVEFLRPQSKVVARFFLQLSGNVTRVS